MRQYVIVSLTDKHFMTFLKSKEENGWEFQDSLSDATCFSKSTADKRATDVQVYLAYNTNYVGDIKVMHKDHAFWQASEQRNEEMTLDKMHSRWCPSYTCEKDNCRFIRDLQSFKAWKT